MAGDHTEVARKRTLNGIYRGLNSRVRHGTSVKLYLPRTLLALTTQNADPDAVDANMGGGETILIVEDDEQVRRYIVETLLELNYRVVEARDAVEANNVFKHSERTIDLLLTDVVMLGKNGRILSEELVRLNPELKVLFMTGYSRDGIVHRGRLDAGVFFLQKPITQRDLAKKVRSVLGPSMKSNTHKGRTPPRVWPRSLKCRQTRLASSRSIFR